MYSVEYCSCPCHNNCWSVVKNETEESCSENVENAPSNSAKKKKSEDEIIKPANDTNEYRAFTLPNKLKAIVVSDPEADKAAACMCVLVGSMHDPEKIPGLAHFCEHMVFLGTEKYPEENFMGKFLAANAGDYNAYTERDMTNYHFDVASTSLEEALDRFAQLFIAPLFLEESVEREVQAINSEHEKNIPYDYERRALVDIMLSRRGHPYSKFDCGNYMTLWIRPKEESIDVVEELKKFFNELYSANLMNLCVLGRETCDELQEMVTRIFSPIKNKDLEIPSWPESPYGPDELATRIDLVPITDVSSVVLIFPVPDQTEHYKIGTTHYIGFLLSHGYLNGLASFLKQKRWSVDGVFASYERPGKGFAFIAVDIDLSNEGLNRVDDVVLCVFQYLQLIRTRGLQKRIWDEIKLLNDIGFCYSQKTYSLTLVNSLARALSNFPRRDILVSVFSVIDDYKPEEISKLLDFLVPTNMRLIVTAKQNEDIADKVDEWYGAKYKYYKIDNALIQKWTMCGLNPALQLPEPNPLLPNTFELKARDSKGGNFPRLIEENLRSEVWFLQDNLYKLPQASIYLFIHSSKPSESESSSNLSELFVGCFLDSISEYCANIYPAGLSYCFGVLITGFYLFVTGYDCKCGDLFEYFVKNLVGYRSVNERFEDISQDYMRELENFADDEPSDHCMSYLDELMRAKYFSNETLLRDMNNNTYTAHDMQEFVRNLFSKVKLKLFFTGNLTEEEVLKTYDKCSAYFDEIDAKPMTSSEWHSTRQVCREAILPAGTINIYPKVHTTHWNSATLIALQCCGGGLREHAMLQLLESILSEPAYDVLRTQEQLGYVVMTDTRRIQDAMSLLFIVQGEREPSYLDERIESFLSDFCETIDRMDEDAFRENVESLAVKISEKPKTLSDQGSNFFDHIYKGAYIFDWSERALKQLQSITLKELQQYFHEWVSPYAVKRKKLSIQIKSQVGDPDLIDQHSHRTSTATLQTKSVTKSLRQEETGDINEASNTEKPILQARISNDRVSTHSSHRSSTGKRFSPSSTNSAKSKFHDTVTQPKSQSQRQPRQDFSDILLEHEQDIAVASKEEIDDEENDDASSLNDNVDDVQSLLDPAHISTPNSSNETTSSNESGSRLKSKDAANQNETNTSNNNGNQTDVTGYLELDDTFSETSDQQSIAGSSNKSTSTKKSKKNKKSLHRQKRKLHKKSSDFTPLSVCSHFYPKVTTRRLEIFEISRKFAHFPTFFQRQHLTVKSSGGNKGIIFSKTKGAVANEANNSAASADEKAWIDHVAQKAVDAAAKDKTLKTANLVEPEGESMLRMWVETLVGKEVQKARKENPKVLKTHTEKKAKVAVMDALKKSTHVKVGKAPPTSGAATNQDNESSGSGFDNMERQTKQMTSTPKKDKPDSGSSSYKKNFSWPDSPIESSDAGSNDGITDESIVLKIPSSAEILTHSNKSTSPAAISPIMTSNDNISINTTNKKSDANSKLSSTKTARDGSIPINTGNSATMKPGPNSKRPSLSSATASKVGNLPAKDGNTTTRRSEPPLLSTTRNERHSTTRRLEPSLSPVVVTDVNLLATERKSTAEGTASPLLSTTTKPEANSKLPLMTSNGRKMPANDRKSTTMKPDPNSKRTSLSVARASNLGDLPVHERNSMGPEPPFSSAMNENGRNLYANEINSKFPEGRQNNETFDIEPSENIGALDHVNEEQRLVTGSEIRSIDGKTYSDATKLQRLSSSHPENSLVNSGAATTRSGSDSQSAGSKKSRQLSVITEAQNPTSSTTHDEKKEMPIPQRQIIIIDNIDEWKKSLEYYPLSEPQYVPINKPGDTAKASESTCIERSEGQDDNINNCIYEVPQETLQYCHFHYCLRHPEQTGSLQNNNAHARVPQFPQTSNCTNGFQQLCHYSYEEDPC